MRPVLSIMLSVLLAACGQHSNENHDPVGDGTIQTKADAALMSVYAAAVLNAARPESDRPRDAGRKPAEVLEFVGIEEGMTVLDMFSGGGYYTEIIAAVVGADGIVIAQTNEAYLKFVGDEFSNRYANDRLANVEILMAENNELSLDASSLDAVMLVLSYHDLFNSDPEQGWPRIDIPAFLAELYEGLEPGGLVGVIDHYAATGASTDSGNTVHRIDPAIVIAGMQAAGFSLEAQSDMLRNPDDDYEKIVFDPELRGKTDRFVMRFRKPA